MGKRSPFLMWFPEFTLSDARRVAFGKPIAKVPKCHDGSRGQEAVVYLGADHNGFLCADDYAITDSIDLFLWQTLPITAILSIVPTFWPISVLESRSQSPPALSIQGGSFEVNQESLDMMSRHLILSIVAVVAFAATGCRTVPSCNSCHMGNVVPSSGCACDDCGSTCGDSCGCTTTCAKSCGPNYEVCLPKPPFAEIRQHLRNNLTCTAGCSDEVYWGEWISDPPKCDPCDCFGNYVGPVGGKCRPGLTGIRHGDDSCSSMCDQGMPCNSCACQAKTRTVGYEQTIPGESTILYDSEVPMQYGSPTPASPSDQTMYRTHTTSTSGRSPHRLGRGSM